MSIAPLLLAALLAPSQGPPPVELHASQLGPRGVLLSESPKPVHGIILTFRQDTGEGKLTLDTTPPAYDEFGFPTYPPRDPPLAFAVTVKHAKSVTKAYPGRRGEPDYTHTHKFWDVTGPKLTSKLALGFDEVGQYPSGRLMGKGPGGAVEWSVLMLSPPPAEPCHPGCFPAGTPVATPSGPRPVESLRAGDAVTVIDDGRAAERRIDEVFVTQNRLLEVRTDAGTLLTTATQPLSLADGTLRGAGDLKPGDRLRRWDGSAVREATVREVVPAGRTERVFNLVVGERSLFVAGGFLARSKPPAMGEAVP